MRVLRRIFGIALILLGLPLALAGGAGVLVTGHADANGAFTAELAPLRTTGYAVVVPDVADLLARHRVASLLTPARLRVTLARTDPPLVLLVAPADAARHYLDGVARTEVTSVGFAAGPQPVRVTDLPGRPLAAELPRSLTLAAGTDVVWDPGAPDGPQALLVMRADGQPDFTATLTVGIRPGWFGPVARGALIGGAALLLAGCVALLWRVPRELVLVVEPHQHATASLSSAEATASLPSAEATASLSSAEATASLSSAEATAGGTATVARNRTPWVLMDRANRNQSGELVPVPRSRRDRRFIDDELEDEMGLDNYDRRDYERSGYDALDADAPAPGTPEFDPPYDDQAANPDVIAVEGRLRAAANRARRWGDRLRNRGRNAAGRHSLSIRAAEADAEPTRDDRGESPYIHTAT